MTYMTHIAGGIVVGGIAYAILPTGGPLTFMAGAALGSLIPDLDHPGTILNKRARSTSVLAGFGHRTLTHSLLFTFIVLGVCLLMGMWQGLCMGLFWGCISHLILDSLNPSGVPWLWPYGRKFSLAKIRTGGGGEYGVFFALAGVIYAYFRFRA